jgi:hypothetical protein
VGLEPVVEMTLVQVGTHEFFPSSWVSLQRMAPASLPVQSSEISSILENEIGANLVLRFLTERCGGALGGKLSARCAGSLHRGEWPTPFF